MTPRYSRFIFLPFVFCIVLAALAEQAPKTASVVQQQTVVTTRQLLPVEAPEQEQGLLSFKTLAQLDELTQIGMPGLALRMIKQQQFLYKAFTADWYAFEYKRIRTLAALDRWDDVAARAGFVLEQAKPPGQITPAIENWFRTQLAIAVLKTGNPEQTLALCRQMLWRSSAVDEALIPIWRRLIIQAYLQMDDVDDARKSLLKYSQDYGEYKSEWRMLQARALLRADRPADVIDLLEGEDAYAAKVLRLVAAVRSRPRHVNLYINDARRELADESLPQSQRRDYLYVLYEAHLTKKDQLSAALVAEQLLSLSRTYSELKDDFHVDGDDLWNLYEEIGERWGNQYNLLVGDDIAWYERASEVQKKAPVRARGLYSIIAFNAQEDIQRQLAHKEIVNSLAASDDGLEVINQLYLHSARAGSPQDLPADVRYRLVDHALSNGDIALAATMMTSLPQPPEGEDLFNWQMRKARVLILEGDHVQGESVLEASLQNQQALDKDRIDRYLQVVFDLQTVGRHKQALELFDLLPEDNMDDKLKRELYYWKAESNYEIGRYGHAALLYFKSALAGDRDMLDLWSQSARFKAADALVKAELYDDAQHAYDGLLKITANDARKRLIRQKLQQIRLLRNAGGDNQTAGGSIHE